MRNLITLFVITLCLHGCAQTELENVDPINKSESMLRLSNSDITGSWVTDIESSSDPNAVYARPVVTLIALPNDKVLLNGSDTLCLTNPNEYVGCMQFNKLQTGIMKGGVLTHCELYSDPVTLTSYYVCLEYTR